MTIAAKVARWAAVLPGGALSIALSATPAPAAAPTCRDLLVASPARTYTCAYTFDDGGEAALDFTFGPSADGSAAFTVAVQTLTGECACDSKGSAKRPAFFAAKTFSCVFRGGGSSFSVVRARVSGRAGDAIKQLSIWSGGDRAALGSCALK